MRALKNISSRKALFRKASYPQPSEESAAVIGLRWRFRPYARKSRSIRVGRVGIIVLRININQSARRNILRRRIALCSRHRPIAPTLMRRDVIGGIRRRRLPCAREKDCGSIACRSARSKRLHKRAPCKQKRNKQERSFFHGHEEISRKVFYTLPQFSKSANRQMDRTGSHPP